VDRDSLEIWAVVAARSSAARTSGPANDLKVPAKLERASYGDVFRHTDRESAMKVLTAAVVAAAAIAASIVAFVTRKSGVDVAAVVLGLAALAALLRARAEIRDVTRPKCR
jgi:hypothetical protein